jgi:hypothetical protein
MRADLGLSTNQQQWVVDAFLSTWSRSASACSPRN